MPHEVECIAHRSTKKISSLVAEISFQQPRSGLRSLVLTHLSCKYAKRVVAGPEALGEALDVTMLECLHAGRPGLDIVCGDINMARPPLSYFKYTSLSRFGRSSGFFSRRSSALLRCSTDAP